MVPNPKNPVVLENRCEALALLERLMRSNASLDDLVLGTSIVSRAGLPVEELYNEAREKAGNRVPEFRDLMLRATL